MGLGAELAAAVRRDCRGVAVALAQGLAVAVVPWFDIATAMSCHDMLRRLAVTAVS